MTNKGSDSHLAGNNLPFIEELYAQYLDDPKSVDPSWVPVFKQYFNGDGRLNNGPSFTPRGLFTPAVINGGGGSTFGASGPSEAEWALEVNRTPLATPGKSSKFAGKVQGLIDNYRLLGHLVAQIDPLARERSHNPPELDPQHYGIKESDMDTPVRTKELFGSQEVPLRQVMNRLKDLYSGPIAVEYASLPSAEEREWLREQIEQNDYASIETNEERVQIYRDLVKATAFEDFLHTKYVGAKRFGASGGESLIPLLSSLLNEAGGLGVRDCIIGMAHRGRLNVLHNIMGKPAEAMLSEFEKTPDPEKYMGSSDVKYHMGYSSDFETTSGNSVHLSLTFNPSHLEFVNPVVLGRARAKQDRRGESRSSVLPLVMHGDAAFAGQGVVAESLNLAEVEGFSVAGTVHLVINNQIGFTAVPRESRSTTYSTDIAKILEVPIFHVNGDDPEACVRVAKLAMRWRQKFKRDVVIDLVCYRRYGHNEGDEPRFTQPIMYSKIDAMTKVHEKYAKKLVDAGVLEADQAQGIFQKRIDEYSAVYEEIHQAPQRAEVSSLSGVWTRYEGGAVDAGQSPKTNLPLDELKALGQKLAEVPDSVNVHRTIQRFLKQRDEMATGERPIDWAMAEALALGSLLKEGTSVRISGQDAIRATFSQRHAGITDGKTGEVYWPLKHLSDDQAKFEVYNSILSECGVLGFEYGYSLDYPDALVIWEAQFGDFANGAQVIIDQFISSGEDKWKRLSGLVMLLPHGYEGQGPEHSSARLERFLQSSAEDNWFVCNLTTPGQYFHALRRQIHQGVRKPLIVMSPKSLLRLREATSTLEELADQTFQAVIPDTRPEIVPDQVKRISLCSGKVYYDLIKYAEEQQYTETAIIRVEQLYPLDFEGLKRAMEPYKNAEEVLWVQEEPKNMGPWNHILSNWLDEFGTERCPRYVGRAPSASPATGHREAHLLEQQKLVVEAFGEVWQNGNGK